MAITIEELTRNVVTQQDYTVTGDGVFDDVMEAVNMHIQAQYDAGRINGSDFATVYLGALQTALQQSIGFVLQREKVEAEIEGIEANTLLTNAKKNTEDNNTVVKEKQIANEIAKEALLQRQTKGFDDDAKQKLLKQMLDSWSVAYSVAKDANSIPDSIKVNPIDSTLKSALDSLNINVTTDPLNQP
jgi:hypothetical protein